MSTYAIGDVQGCFRTFERLLGRVGFAPSTDRIWLAGDLVNRGPRSLHMLEWASAHDGRVVSVLGNHDLHLLALALGVGVPKPKDSLGPVFASRARDRLLDWIRERRFLHVENGAGAQPLVLVHAGLLPEWSLAEALGIADELERVLRGPLAPALLRGLYERAFPAWHERMPVMTRLKLALSVFTRLRCVDGAGRIELGFKGPLDELPPGLVPWFRARRAPETVLFGHWSALGFTMVDGAVCLDSGCYRGRALTALRVSDGAAFQEPCSD